MAVGSIAWYGSSDDLVGGILIPTCALFIWKRFGGSDYYHTDNNFSHGWRRGFWDGFFRACHHGKIGTRCSTLFGEFAAKRGLQQLGDCECKKFSSLWEGTLCRWRFPADNRLADGWRNQEQCYCRLLDAVRHRRFGNGSLQHFDACCSFVGRWYTYVVYSA
jgi:hypothetical protein